MRKIYKKLTQDQINRGVIFSSGLSTKTSEEDSGVIHEVTKTDEDATKKIKLLLDDSFFNGSPWKYNIIREG